MTTVQARMTVLTSNYNLILSYQDVFIIPDGASGALAELERRKFTAEEGVGITSILNDGMN